MRPITEKKGNETETETERRCKQKSGVVGETREWETNRMSGDLGGCATCGSSGRDGGDIFFSFILTYSVRYLRSPVCMWSGCSWYSRRWFDKRDRSDDQGKSERKMKWKNIALQRENYTYENWETLRWAAGVFWSRKEVIYDGAEWETLEKKKHRSERKGEKGGTKPEE